MASVTFEGVSKRYGDVTAVDGLSLDVRDGEFMVLLGPSGCGKTTALRMVAGLEEISDGTLRIGDDVVNRVEPAQRDVSMVFQSYALYPHMTVRGNIESPLIARRYPVDGTTRKLTKVERAERVAEAARALELTPYLDRKPRALSGGQRQRVALARAIVGRPKAFLMDEPLSNLDAKLRTQTRRELVELHQRVGTTVIYVTHDQTEAMTMATRIAVMSAGRLQQAGTPEEIYTAPANQFVARFLGSPPMNCLDGKVTVEGITVGEAWFPIPTGLRTRLEEGRLVTVGVRPEHLSLDAAGTVKAQVRASEWLGHDRLVFCTLDGQDLLVRATSDPPSGVVTFAVDPANVHVFDTESGQRLT
ncbi:ABC transporter ATP-binding protein [Actinocrispum wychmicini]|uniref:sn-glycerol 3-phosphate transport system ATP-binding protein/multiple sugar transport system ATP-binding protein n=1 Tax=Actinocrispum wychmicini TaxID=1213861 RepID=A0A4R2JRK1_9PSEU|nr:ATP-binding cassette domain-containing protein [Actinocrispum wychmicini]TCO62154.1 sn-glycerol 3-phosphate transport system ATP-binding protein/multiple sugar transport system ATP-binding protein [Actinocrispum wychmicini]